MINISTSILIALCIALASSLHFNHTAHLIPHPMKVSKGGQDAFFASRSLLVVADGVGGWNNQGIDPSLYSKFLCSASEVYFNEDPFHYTRSPQELITKAQQNNRHPGSSTMSVVTLQGNTLRSCHIGDCRLFVLRRYETYRLIFETVDQLHGFNFPFQLAQEHYGGDNPLEAICSSVSVKEDDLIILASDGMADNIFSHEVNDMAEKSFQAGKLSGLAKKLAKQAVERSSKKEGTSPFSVKASEWGISYKGGKVDDTTVIVAQIQGEAPPKTSELTDL